MKLMNIKIDNKLINKLIGIINIFLGVLYIASPLVYQLVNQIFVLPRINQMYADFNINAKPSYTLSYIILGIMVIMGVVSLFLGLSVLKNKDNKYLKYGITMAIIFFVLYGILIGVANLPIIFSIYNLTSQL
jgi:hypothetical protein